MDFNQSSDRLMVEDLEPLPRDRCNTWPSRPIINSPSIHDSESNAAEGVIKEEPEDLEPGLLDTKSQHNISGGTQDNLPVTNTPGLCANPELGSQSDLSNSKKSTARKNAWGNLSYADLITKAIQSSPEKKLTLSQIYDWMVQNVNYFRDKGDSTSSAGWKNSIRHNLSLHNRFMRIQNEGAGKSSWWVINPDAKPGKAPRRPRGGSMDSTKMNLEASRKRAMKKVNDMKKKGLLKDNDSHSPVSTANDFTLSPETYRDRASSFASNMSGRHSPIHDPDLLGDAKLSPWGSDNQLLLDDINMESNSTLHEDLESMMKLEMKPGGSFLSALEGNSGPYMDHSSMYGKPFPSYIGDGSNNFNPAPPPPYPSDQSQQQHFDKRNLNGPSPGMYKDPMMTGYNIPKGNNNSLSPNTAHRPYPGYSNGIISNQPVPQQQTQPQTRMPSMNQAQTQREIPSSLREALHQPSPLRRPANQTISQSLKESAPILTQQLLDYQPNMSRQPNYNNSHVPNQQSFPQYSQDQNNIYMNQGLRGDTSLLGSQNSYYPNDLDLNFDPMPELDCDVDEVIQQELRMDGGQLDFSGFEGYTQQQLASNTGNSMNPSILSQALE